MERLDYTPMTARVPAAPWRAGERPPASARAWRTGGNRGFWLLGGLIGAAVLVVLAGCGRKSEPLPPLIEVPETTSDLAVRQEGGEAVLTWSFPQLTRAGRRLVDLARVEVWRLDVPAGQEQVGAGAAGVELRRQLMLSRGRLIARLEGRDLEAATRGALIEVRDALPPAPPGQVAPTFWYAVRSRRRDGTPSALSNIATWEVKMIPPAVQGLVATPTASGISLTWQEVPEATYEVERIGLKAAAWQAVSTSTLPQPSFVDATAALSATWRYRVRAISQGVWGPASPEVRVAYPDIYPPAPVTNLVCLPEGNVVHLRWDPLAEPKVLYRVFRRRGEVWLHLIDDGREPRFSDTEPPAGDAEYAVKSVDASGNESDPVYCTVRGER